jgi:hypothetical protein
MEPFPTGDTDTTAPVLQRPGQSPALGPGDIREVPRGLRGRHQPVMNSPAELAARRKEAAARRAEEERQKLDENYQRIRAFMGGEEPWTVQTPGGPVVTGGPERPTATPAEPRPALGGT